MIYGDGFQFNDDDESQLQMNNTISGFKELLGEINKLIVNLNELYLNLQSDIDEARLDLLDNKLCTISDIFSKFRKGTYMLFREYYQLYDDWYYSKYYGSGLYVEFIAWLICENDPKIFATKFKIFVDNTEQGILENVVIREKEGFARLIWERRKEKNLALVLDTLSTKLTEEQFVELMTTRNLIDFIFTQDNKELALQLKQKFPLLPLRLLDYSVGDLSKSSQKLDLGLEKAYFSRFESPERLCLQLKEKYDLKNKVLVEYLMKINILEFPVWEENAYYYYYYYRLFKLGLAKEELKILLKMQDQEGNNVLHRAFNVRDNFGLAIYENALMALGAEEFLDLLAIPNSAGKNCFAIAQEKKSDEIVVVYKQCYSSNPRSLCKYSEKNEQQLIVRVILRAKLNTIIGDLKSKSEAKIDEILKNKSSTLLQTEKKTWKDKLEALELKLGLNLTLKLEREQNVEIIRQDYYKGLLEAEGEVTKNVEMQLKKCSQAAEKLLEEVSSDIMQRLGNVSDIENAEARSIYEKTYADFSESVQKEVKRGNEPLGWYREEWKKLIVKADVEVKKITEALAEKKAKEAAEKKAQEELNKILGKIEQEINEKISKKYPVSKVQAQSLLVDDIRKQALENAQKDAKILVKTIIWQDSYINDICEQNIEQTEQRMKESKKIIVQVMKSADISDRYLGEFINHDADRANLGRSVSIHGTAGTYGGQSNTETEQQMRMTQALSAIRNIHRKH